jgi:hypothetical protein
MIRMNDCPWIDPSEVDELQARYPMLQRNLIELALEAYWPIKNDVEAALLTLVANQQRKSAATLDFTPAS